MAAACAISDASPPVRSSSCPAMTSCARRSIMRSASARSTTDPPGAKPVYGERELVHRSPHPLEHRGHLVLSPVVAVQEHEPAAAGASHFAAQRAMTPRLFVHLVDPLGADPWRHPLLRVPRVS